MKKTLYFFAALTMAASSAMASKARQAALSSTPAVTDIQGIFTNPADMHYVGDFVTFEMGEKSLTTTTATDATPNAEAGFIQTKGDAKFGVYLGKLATDTNTFRKYASTAASVTFLQQENPFEVFYGAKAGDLNWGASFSYSNSEMKNAAGATDDQKQSAMGVRMGVKTDVWGAYANVGLGSQATVGDAKFTGKSGLTIGGHYMIDNMKIYVKDDMSGAKAKNTAGTDQFDMDSSELSVGFTNKWMSEGNVAFYGLAYKMKNVKQTKVGLLNTAAPTSFADDTKIDTTSMPFHMGVEVLAASWMKLRGSITQNILMGNNKTTVATGSTVAATNDSIAQNTTTAAGAGFLWGHNVLDVVMTMGTNGGLDAATLGTNASYTYTF